MGLGLSQIILQVGLKRTITSFFKTLMGAFQAFKTWLAMKMNGMMLATASAGLLGSNANGPFITQHMRSSITNKTRQWNILNKDLVEVFYVKIGKPRNGSRLRKFGCFFQPTPHSYQLRNGRNMIAVRSFIFQAIITSTSWYPLDLGGVRCEDCPMEESDAILLPSFSHHESLGGLMIPNLFWTALRDQ